MYRCVFTSLAKVEGTPFEVRVRADQLKAYYFRSLNEDNISELKEKSVMVVENQEQFFAHAELFAGLENAELVISAEESRFECKTDRGEIFSENLMPAFLNLHVSLGNGDHEE